MPSFPPWPRIARLVVPDLPHHVTQRGNGRRRTFFEDGDYRLYLDLLAESSARARTEVWAYCLMPNHVHVILVPSEEDGLHRTFADLHRRYTGFVNVRARATGHLWQGRYGSAPMDEAHLASAVRYVTLNPVRAAGGAGCRLALVERADASCRQGRPRGAGRPVLGGSGISLPSSRWRQTTERGSPRSGVARRSAGRWASRSG